VFQTKRQRRTGTLDDREGCSAHFSLRVLRCFRSTAVRSAYSGARRRRKIPTSASPIHILLASVDRACGESVIQSLPASERRPDGESRGDSTRLPQPQRPIRGNPWVEATISNRSVTRITIFIVGPINQTSQTSACDCAQVSCVSRKKDSLRRSHRGDLSTPFGHQPPMLPLSRDQSGGYPAHPMPLRDDSRPELVHR
jgi:hypothetical protein